MTVAITPRKVAGALRRTTTPEGDRRWLVSGDEELGDPAPRRVFYDPDTGRHICSCYVGAEDEPFGGSRRRYGCVHAVAAVLAQKRRASLERIHAEREMADGATGTHDAPVPLPLPSDQRFHRAGEPPFDDWVQGFRRHQWEAVEAITDAYSGGAKVVFLQAPVGTGKTLTAELVRRLLGGRALYICSTKTLQHQAARDFSYAKLLKGRANYPTLTGGVDAWGRASDDPRSIPTCADCTATPSSPDCRWCAPTSACPYRVARNDAARARLAILNYAYALTDWNKGSRRFFGRELAIMDEADTIEGELMNQVEVKISRRRRERYKIREPEYRTIDLERGRGPAEAWLPWVNEEAIPKITKALSKLPPFHEADTRQIRERKSLEELLERLLILQRELPEGGWIYDGYTKGDVIFRPVRVDAWGQMIWPHAQRFLLMSGTIISADELSESLGLKEEHRLVDIPMTFPVENRRINIVALVEMRNKDIETCWPKMAEGVAGVLRLHPDERILVHTVSYRFADYLQRQLPHSDRTIQTYTDSSERDRALERYKQDPRGVLLAPSMDRGVDLPGDLCRVQVICKIPYPNLGDKRTNARLHSRGGEEWFQVQTVRSLVQMTGRGIRSHDDHAVTYILDHQFTTNLWKKSRRLLPSWWCDAVNWRYPVRRILVSNQ